MDDAKKRAENEGMRPAGDAEKNLEKSKAVSDKKSGKKDKSTNSSSGSKSKE